MGASVQASGGDERRGRRGRRRGKYRAMSEINVTPFVDVMLVLLIIFMVSAPLMTVGVPVNLPDTAAEALPVEQEEPLTVAPSARRKILSLVRSAAMADSLSISSSAGVSVEQEEPLTVTLTAEGALLIQTT
ncbi:MAG: biopolymer transporter ExbD, partial [Pseudomonadota bacterium]